jgi:hypothetical protein
MRGSRIILSVLALSVFVGLGPITAARASCDLAEWEDTPYVCATGASVPVLGESADDLINDSNYHGFTAVPTTLAQAEDALYVPPTEGLQAKLDLLAAWQPTVDANLATGAAGETDAQVATCVTNDCPSTPPSYPYLSQPMSSQYKTYTCGPESARIILWQMTGSTLTEASLETEMHTTSSNGTYVNSIPPVLNHHQNNDVFRLSQIHDPSTYMGYLTTDVAGYTHGLINGLLTNRLSFWNGHTFHHADISYGYNHKNSTVAMGEEWDPTRFGDSLKSYGYVNPYGLHPSEPLSNVYEAIYSNGGYVIW